MTMTPHYRMNTFTLTVPAVDNSGADRPDHLASVREGLQREGIVSWTEAPCLGYWHGKGEAGTLLTLYVPDATNARTIIDTLGRVGRAAMPDQEAVQVTFTPATAHLFEF